jgi:hypothetical protein
VNQKFSKLNFLAANDGERETLCAELAKDTAQRILQSSSFHEAVSCVIEQLRIMGHDLWSYDESDDFEIWGPNYAEPTGPGVVVTFRLEGGVQVEWDPGRESSQ